MLSHLHCCFDQYLFKPLAPICHGPNNLNSVSEEFLGWHFWQCVLANVRGTGELMFETGFPPSEDVMAMLLAEPYGRERFEMELALRLEVGNRGKIPVYHAFNN